MLAHRQRRADDQPGQSGAATKLHETPMTRRQEMATLILISVFAAGIFVFLVAAALATGGEAYLIDRRILLALRHPDNLAIPIGPAWMAGAARGVTALAGTPVLTIFTLILSGYFALKRRWRMLALVLVAVLGETLIVDVLKDLFDRQRPDVVPHLVEVSSPSFPSGHSASAAAVYLTFGAILARTASSVAVRRYVIAIAVLLALMIGASRVYLGVHYLSDVIGGLSFGAAWAAIVLLAARRFEKKRD